jgi:3D (Asp-Asp-Asp) domain-containing protein
MAATLDRTIPFGTRLRVPGFGVVVVTDRIGHGSDLDLYLGSSPGCARAARAWGRRHLVVEELAA